MQKPPYSPSGTPTSWNKPVDFFTRRPHYLDHLAKTWLALSDEYRGLFYVPECMKDYSKIYGFETVPLKPRGSSPLIVHIPANGGPTVTAAYGDLQRAYLTDPSRPYMLTEHGVGLTFKHPGYAGGEGGRRNISLFICPNKHTLDKNRKTFPSAPGVVVGTPKLDHWHNAPIKERDEPPTVAISFHWDGHMICPEAGNAFWHYKSIIPELKKHFNVIGHSHPLMADKMYPFYESHGIKTEKNFDEVMEIADLYINDCSSTLYEFCVTGKPVVILNSPHFRKHITHGIRFWEYTDIGPVVEKPEELIPAINDALSSTLYKDNIDKMLTDLYPHFGNAAKTTAEAIIDFVEGKRL
jgi:hypothetical protein